MNQKDAFTLAQSWAEHYGKADLNGEMASRNAAALARLCKVEIFAKWNIPFDAMPRVASDEGIVDFYISQGITRGDSDDQWIGNFIEDGKLTFEFKEEDGEAYFEAVLRVPDAAGLVFMPGCWLSPGCPDEMERSIEAYDFGFLIDGEPVEFPERWDDGANFQDWSDNV